MHDKKPVVWALDESNELVIIKEDHIFVGGQEYAILSKEGETYVCLPFPEENIIENIVHINIDIDTKTLELNGKQFKIFKVQ